MLRTLKTKVVMNSSSEVERFWSSSSRPASRGRWAARLRPGSTPLAPAGPTLIAEDPSLRAGGPPAGRSPGWRRPPRESLGRSRRRRGRRSRRRGARAGGARGETGGWTETTMRRLRSPTARNRGGLVRDRSVANGRSTGARCRRVPGSSAPERVQDRAPVRPAHGDLGPPVHHECRPALPPRHDAGHAVDVDDGRAVDPDERRAT